MRLFTNSQFLRSILLTSLLTLIFSSTSFSETEFSSVDECVYVQDSLQLCYNFVTPTGVANVLIITLPMLGRDRNSFSAIDNAIEEKFDNVAIVNFDLRGHGQSIREKSDTISYRTMEKAEFVKMPADIKDALKQIRENHKELKNTPVIAIGASIGANTAAILANIETSVKAAALLSPGLDYRGLTPGPHLMTLLEKRILILVGKSDTYAYESSDSLRKISSGETEYSVYNTRLHGTSILNETPEALDELLEWLDETIHALTKN